MEKNRNPQNKPSGSSDQKSRTFDPNDLNSIDPNESFHKTPDIDIFNILNEPISKHPTKPIETKTIPQPPSKPKVKIPPPSFDESDKRSVYSTEEAKKQDFSQKTTINFASLNVPPQNNTTWQQTSPSKSQVEATKQSQTVWWIIGIIFWIVIMRGCW